MNRMLFWLYIILLILTSFAVSFVLTYKLTDTSVSNLYWILGGVAFLVWIMVLVGIWFVIRPKTNTFNLTRGNNMDVFPSGLDVMYNYINDREY